MSTNMNLGYTPNYYLSNAPSNVPFSYGNIDFQTTNSRTIAQVAGTGLFQTGKDGVSASVPYAPGFEPTAVDVENPLGYFRSPFFQNEASLNYGPDNFGPNNPFSPVVPNSENPFETFTQGNFDAYSPSSSSYSSGGSSYGGSGYGGSSYGGGGYGDSSSYGGSGYGGSSYGGSGYGDGSSYGSSGYGGSSYGGSGYSSGYPSNSGSGYVQAPPGYTNSYDPGLFTGVSPGQIAGLAQTVATTSDNYASQYSTLTDGRYGAVEIGSDTGTPEQYWNSAGVNQGQFGIYEAIVGPEGGTANAGYYGVQAVGDAFALTANPLNAGITNVASPEYNNYNFANQTGYL